MRLSSKQLYDDHFDFLERHAFPALVPGYTGPRVAVVSADSEGRGVIRLNPPPTAQGYYTPLTVARFNVPGDHKPIIEVPVITTYTYVLQTVL